MNEEQRIGLMIRSLRISAGYSQEKMAELTGMGQSHITRIEQGRYSARIHTIGRILDALNKKIDFVDKDENTDFNELLSQGIENDPANNPV